MLNEPLVSVIIPNFNHEIYLKQRIESVLDQTFTDFELIILDDHSTDNSRAIIETYRSNHKIKHIIYNDANSGSPFIQWKKGIELALGKYIWIAESDDYSDPAFLETVTASMEKEPAAVICYTDSNIVENGKVDETANPSYYYNKLFASTRWFENFVNDGIDELINYMGGFCTIINASGCVFLKSAFPLKSKALDKFKYCGDWFTWIEMLGGGKIIYLKKPLNYFRIHANSTVNQFAKIKKAKELYQCLTRARELTKGKSVIPNETLENFLYLWAHNSLYFFLRNFRFSLFMMHARLDKHFIVKIKRLSKGYFKLKFS